MDPTERTPLLSTDSSSGSHPATRQTSRNEGAQEKFKLKRHITMWNAVFIIIGSVIGSGIFVSPKGVTKNVNSVGASLVIWTVTGLINLGQALCYAELGGMIPIAGGDYAYLYYILGPLPAFLVVWLHIMIISASGCAVIARTAALYILQPLGLSCRLDIISVLGAIIIVTLAMVNAVSSPWGKRIHTMFAVAKVFALLMLIILGIVLLSTGHTSHFENAFEGSTTDPGRIGLSVLDGYFAYKGWELVNALPEEMINPARDLQPAVVIGMMSVIVIYVLTNAAYFTILSPAELISSDAVAVTYSSAILPQLIYVTPIFVALSCMGAVNGDFLGNSRYLFASGRFKQAPRVLSFIHMKFLTPFLSIVFLCFVALLYCVFTNLQVLQEYSSLAVELKTILALVALFYYRWKKPDLYRPYKVNSAVAFLTFIITLAIIGLSLYQSPAEIGIGLAMFACGIPLYYLGLLCRNSSVMNRKMDCLTRFLQKVFLLVPETTDKQNDG